MLKNDTDRSVGGTPGVLHPYRLGVHSLSNRWVMAPIVTRFPVDADWPTDDHVDFYAGLASTGVGMIIVGATAVNHEGRGYPDQMCLDEHAPMARFSLLARAAQRSAPAILQLFHAGPKTSRAVRGALAVGPSERSAIRARYDAARALSQADIEQVLHDFAESAKLAMKAGFAGVELHAANGYLLHAFCDSAVNHRSDRWRDPFAFADEACRLVRRAVSRDFIVGCALSPARAESSETVTEDTRQRFIELSRRLESTGIDYLRVYRSKAEESARRGGVVYASQLRESGINLPIIEGSGITSSIDGDAFLRAGADLVAVGRALLADRSFLRLGTTVDDNAMEALTTAAGIEAFFVEEQRRLMLGRARCGRVRA